MTSSNSRKFISLVLVASSLFLPAFLTEPAVAQQSKTKKARSLKLPTTPRPRVAPKPEPYDDDILIVMPNPQAEQDDVDDLLKDNSCTIVATMGTGPLKAYKIRVPKGKLQETEKKLGAADQKQAKEKKPVNFSRMGRNYHHKAQWSPNDPRIGDEWHLAAMHVHEAWDKAKGSGVTVAVFDTGVQASLTDLAGKTKKGCDATEAGQAATAAIPGAPIGDPLALTASTIAAAAGSGGDSDRQLSSRGTSHGTMVASCLAATANNAKDIAGVAPEATIYPIVNSRPGADEKYYTDEWTMMAGMLNVLAHPEIRIVNVSYGGQCIPVSPIHAYYTYFYQMRQGLVFVSAGNDRSFNHAPPMPWCNVVSAVDRNLELADFGGGAGSSTGNCTTFTGPGKEIPCLNKSGAVMSVQGTSFSSPIVAAVAALVLSANPALPAPAVQAILIKSCIKPEGKGGFTTEFGWGMPDAEKAVNMAKFGL